MLHGVVAPTVTFGLYALKHFRIALHILAHTKKRGFVACQPQHIKDARRPFWMRAIVKCEVNFSALGVARPEEFWKQRSDRFGYAGGVHVCKFTQKKRNSTVLIPIWARFISTIAAVKWDS